MDCLQTTEFWSNYFLNKNQVVKQCSICESVNELKKIFPKSFLGENFAAHHTDQWIGCIDCKESHHKDNFCECGTCFFASDFKQDQENGYTFGKCKGCGKRQIWD